MEKPKFNDFPMLSPLTIQKYERYLPTAFDESMSLLEKSNKIIEFLNHVERLLGNFKTDWETFANYMIDYLLNIETNVTKTQTDFVEFWETFVQDVYGGVLKWQPPVASASVLYSVYPNAKEGWASMVRDTGKVYRFDGANWIEFLQIEATPINEVDNRLTAKLDKAMTLLSRPKTVEQVIEMMINKQPVKIVARGDSITFGYVPNAGTQTANPYPKTLQAILREYYGYDGITVINMGNSGKQSDEFASDSYVNEVLAEDPDMIIFMCGINDARGGTSGGAVVPVNDYKNNIALMVSKLDYPFIFMTPTFFQDTEDKKNRFAQYVQAMREMAKTLNVKLIDLHDIVLKDLTMREVAFEDVAPDNIHFIDSYYQKIAEFVFAHGLCNVDIKANENTFIDPLSVLWRWKGTANLFSSIINPLKKNIFLRNDFEHLNEIKLYLYVDRTDLALQPLYVPNASTSPNNTIEVNGVSYPQPYTTPSQTIWKLKEGLFDLKYGLNKIVFKTNGDVVGKVYNLIYGANVIKREKNVFGKNVVFSGAYNIGADVQGTQKTRKLVSFKHNNFTKLTVKFVPNAHDSGIGFGTGFVLHNGSLVEYPLSTILFNGTTTNLYDFKKNYNTTMFAENGSLGYGTMVAGTEVFNLGVENTLEVTLSVNNYVFKLNGVELLTLPKALYNLGVLDVWGYSVNTSPCVVNEISIS